MSELAEKTSAPATVRPRSIWVVTDGRRGIENQALGLAEAVRDQLAATGTSADIYIAIARKDGYVTLPDSAFPDLWIGCGRAAIPIAAKHRRIFPNCFFAYVQDPRTQYRRFDLIIAPQHDRLVRDNAIAMLGSPNRIRPDMLAADAENHAERIQALPEPRAAVLIGGDSKRYRMTRPVTDYLIKRLRELVGQGLGLMLTVSRRTPDEARKRFEEAFSGNDRVWFFDGEGENPYFAFLGSADWIFVTEESTNMIVEACATGKPVYVLPLSGTPGKFSRLHAQLEGRNAIRPYLGQLDRWSYEPVDETSRIAALLIAQWQTEMAQGE